MASESSASPPRMSACAETISSAHGPARAQASAASALACTRTSTCSRNFCTVRSAVLSESAASRRASSSNSGPRCLHCAAGGSTSCAKTRGSITPSASSGAASASQLRASAAASCKDSEASVGSSAGRVSVSTKLARESTGMADSGEPGAAASTARMAGKRAAPSWAVEAQDAKKTERTCLGSQSRSTSARSESSSPASASTSSGGAQMGAEQPTLASDWK
mmetsp:Transcript_657/g.1945  ORF Transcript_657/g.1945 Transcript_657/m.1945 type:complete len:221 (-) Transcript_657:2205-2867(-)|eukprot:scaffold2032_cov112-Isochrysis_galbana.AAC.6